ncbi:MAG TPA: polysaccharide biosynthesis C-terminal domain-containing protein, partial [Terriglobales bacterium]|nr:polysaccharide biosynthesis C-terminal domain-containing protein [Terriglobales bacterium]
AFNKLCVLAGAAVGFAVGHSLGGAVAGLLIGTAVSLCGTVLLLGRLGAPIAARWDRAWNRALLAQSLPLVVSWIFWNLYDNQDVVVLAYLGLPSASVGHFAAAMKLIDALRGAPVLIAGAVFPILSVGARDGADHFARVAMFLLRAALSAALPVAVAAWALAPALVRWIYGPGFEPAAGVLRIAGWAVIGIFLNHALINLLVALDLQRWTVAGAAGAAVVNLAALLILTPPFGLRGAAASLVISEGVFLAINIAVLRGHTAGLLGPLALGALQPLAASGLMGAFLVWVAAAWHPLAAGAAGLALYVVALAALGGLRFARWRPA